MGDWELTFDYKFVDDVQTQWVGAGVLICPPDTNRRDYQSVQIWIQDFYFKDLTNSIGSKVSIPNFTRGTWYNKYVAG